MGSFLRSQGDSEFLMSVSASIFGTLVPSPGARERRRAPQADAAPRPRVAKATFPASDDAADEGILASSRCDARADSIQSSLIKRYMRESVGRLPLGIGLGIAMAWVCLPAVPGEWVLLWLAVVVIGNLYRVAAESTFARQGRHATVQAQKDFVRRIGPVYIIIGAAWGCSVLLFLNRLGPEREFACWAILASILYVPLPRLALVPQLCRRQINPFFMSLLPSFILAACFVSPVPHSTPVAFWLYPVALPQWWLARRMGRDIGRTAAEHYGLMFDLAVQKEKAVEAVKTKHRFLAAATHDIRQPVTALGLYAEHLESFPETHVELAPKIGRASQAINSLFNSLFDLSNLDSGEVVLSVEPVAIADVIHSLEVAFEPLARARGIELHVRVADGTVRTDQTRLRRMIGNVLSNAIKYSEAGGKVLLAARVHGDQVRVEVWDQGIGIPAEQIDKVFQEFYRGEGGMRLAPDGMGIGLSLVTRLARALNTRLSIASVEGRGTRVTMSIGDVDPDPEKRRMSVAWG